MKKQATGAAKAVKTARTGSALTVRDYMSSPVTTLTPDQRLLEADLLIRRSPIRHFPVLSDGRLIGLLTERDVRRVAPSILDSTPENYNAIFENTLVAAVMTKDVRTISPDAPLSQAASILYQERMGCLPVLERGRLVGILTRTDVLHYAFDALNGRR